MIETTRIQEPDDLPRTEALTHRGSIPPKEPDPLRTQAMPAPDSTQEQPQNTQVVRKPPPGLRDGSSLQVRAPGQSAAPAAKAER